MESYTVHEIERSGRIGRLIDHLFAKMPEIEADRAVLLTDSYMQTEGEPQVVRRAKAFSHILKNIPLEASFYNAMKKQFPTITDVAVTPSGGVQLYAVIAMKQRYANEARHVILSAMSSNVRPKWIVVVDPDINVHDSAEVEWALSFRVDPGRDVILVNNVPSAPLDPSSHGDSLQEKTNSTIGIDATMPFGKLYATVAEVAGWEDYSFPEISSER